jgi:hypothetical protein
VEAYLGGLASWARGSGKPGTGTVVCVWEGSVVQVMVLVATRKGLLRHDYDAKKWDSRWRDVESRISPERERLRAWEE